MTQEEIIDRLKANLQIIRPKMDPNVINAQSRLSEDLALDSLSMLMLSLAIENDFNISFDFIQAPKTVQDVIDFILAKTK
ncbi:MAG: acyl carrier protein [Paludibacteraceae bacterium]|nr:acyl carrier protein [Paludibacteraceae bacterium]